MDEWQYLNTLAYIKSDGNRKHSSTGIDTFGILGVQHRYDIKNNKLPLFTTKKVWFKGVAVELLWFLRGNTNLKYMVDRDVNIWSRYGYKHYKKITLSDTPLEYDEWLNTIKKIDDNLIMGDMGPIYGKQWRSFGYAGMAVDQITKLIFDIRNNPDSKRHILTSWDPLSIPDAALPPHHVLAQFSVVDGELTCHMYQQSCDMFLEVPFNVASYSLLTHIIAELTGLKGGELIHTMHDCYIYENHLEAVCEQLSRIPTFFPTIEFNFSDRDTLKDILDREWDDLFKIHGYEPHKPIKAELVT